MATAVATLRAIEGAPLRTVRLSQLAAEETNPWRAADRLVNEGALIRLSPGIYTAPPDGLDARTWKPDLQAAGLAVATARFGERNAVLMGIGAARHWAAIPRAIGVTTVAVPAAGRPVVRLAQGGAVHFIARNLARLDAVLDVTELGRALVTTPAQTLYDLLMKPKQGGEPQIAQEAADNLIARVTAAELQHIVDETKRANGAVRQALRHAPLKD
jgi:hypothetical protein